MPEVRYAGLLFLERDFAIEVAGHARELGDHRLDLRDAPTFFVHMETL